MWFAGLQSIRCRLLLLATVLVLGMSSLAGLKAAPPNDSCAGAVVIPSAATLPYWTAVITNVTSATTADDPTLPECFDGPVTNSIWFAYQPAASGAYTFSISTDTATTFLDTSMGIYAASAACAGLTLIGCSDDEGDLKSATNVVLNAGTLYYVIVWFKSAFLPAGPGEDSVQLRVSRPEVPSNDQCAGAELIPATGPFPYFTSTNDITRGTLTGDPPHQAGCGMTLGRKSAWFRFTPAATGTYLISTGEGTGTTIYDTILGVYRTSVCGTYTNVDCNYVEGTRAELTRTLSADTRYYFVVWDAETNSPTYGETSLQLVVAPTRAPAVTTLPASQISSTGARLHGSFLPNAVSTRVWFEWGTTTNYGNRTVTRLIGSGVRNIATNLPITGLTPGTVYHYRAVGTNSLGTNYGANATFVWANTKPQIRPLESPVDGSYVIRFTAVAGQMYRIEASETFHAWTDVGIAQDVGGGSFQFVESRRERDRPIFYRVKGP